MIFDSLKTSLFPCSIILIPNTPRCIQKFPDGVDNEIYAYNNKHSFRDKTKGYGGKTH